MNLRSFFYVVKETFLSIKRNAWMSLASAATVAISLVILGLALTLVYNTTQISTAMGSDIEISAYMQSGQTLTQVQDAKAKVAQLQGVRSVNLLTKEQAMEQFKTTVSAELVQNLGDSNPLPDKLAIKADQPELVKPLAKQIAKIPGVATVRYGQGVVERIVQFTYWVRLIGFGIIAMLTIASIVLISITIKFTVFSRRREVQIMKFVGATDWYIRWPFLIEGMLLGLVGAVMAAVMVVYTYNGLSAYMHNHMSFIPIANDPVFLNHTVWGLVVAGTVIGAIGSMSSLRKFLKV